ncbi:MAG: DUF72 domain-containing protein [Candidatus Zixiibacteriota bacterium]
MDKINIGTSGYIYDHWKGRFYPEDLPQEKWFEYYAESFDTVEINNTFYNLPEETTFEKWRDRASKDFCYAVKANRYITHMKKLKDPKEPWNNFWNRAKILDNNLGPVLFQLPPNWNANPERLKNFISVLPDNLLCAFEFRDPSWYNDDIFKILSDSGHTLCIHDMDTDDVPDIMIGDFAYLRFHGITGKYQGKYGRDNLEGKAKWLKENVLSKGKPVFAYFNNDDHGYAPEDAKLFRNMLSE